MALTEKGIDRLQVAPTCEPFRASLPDKLFSFVVVFLAVLQRASTQLVAYQARKATGT